MQNAPTEGQQAASGEIGQSVVGGAQRQGHSRFVLCVKGHVRDCGKAGQPVALSDLQGKGLCGKRSILLTAFFGYFLWRQKVTSPRGYERKLCRSTTQVKSQPRKSLSSNKISAII